MQLEDKIRQEGTERQKIPCGPHSRRPPSLMSWDHYDISRVRSQWVMKSQTVRMAHPLRHMPVGEEEGVFRNKIRFCKNRDMVSYRSKREEKVEMPGDEPPAVCSVYLSTLGSSCHHLCFSDEATQTQSSCPAREQKSEFTL